MRHARGALSEGQWKTIQFMLHELFRFSQNPFRVLNAKKKVGHACMLQLFVLFCFVLV